MQKGIAACVVAVVSLAGSFAYADHASDDKEISELKVPAPEAGVDAAKPAAPAWCDVAEKLDGNSWSAGTIKRGLDDESKVSLETLIQDGTVACLWAKEPAMAHATQMMLQHWMNWTGLPQDKAAETLRLHMAKDKFAADKKALCEQLKGNDEDDGEDKAFMQARAKLFGCKNDSALWMSGGGYMEVDDSVITFLDASVSPPDALARLGYLMSRTRFVFGESPSDRELLGYITDQFDIAAVNDAEALKLLDTAPYKGNTYAQATVIESLGRMKLAARHYQALVDKKSTDADWKKLLVTAPQQGAADFTKATAKWKDQLARSMEFEKKFWGPSKKAMQGCWAGLRKDFIDVVKTLKHGTVQELKESLSDPVASLLMSRLVGCAAVDQDPAYVGQLYKYAIDLRPSRGPRLAAYFAALDALSQILDDRAKFPVALTDLKRTLHNDVVEAGYHRTDNDKSKIDSMGFVGDAGKSMVKSVKKTAGGMQITWVHTSYKTMNYNCVDTNHIVMFDISDGRPIYKQKCTPTGMVTVNTTPLDITVPTEWADGIKANTLVEFEAARGNDAKRIALPTAVYADKDKKKLVNWLGFGL